MIKEIHISQMKGKLIKDPSAKFYVVMQRLPDYVRLDQVQACPVLAPLSEILQKLKTCQIEWIEYKRKYLQELQNPVAQELIKFIAHEAKKKDVYLYPLQIQYFTNWIEKSFSFIPISKYFSIKCLKS